VLDWAHRTALRAVADGGERDESPALRSLLAAGLAERTDDGGYAVTTAGEAALAAAPGRADRIAWTALVVCVSLLFVDAVIGWVT
jgi:hypothetical protein